MTLRVPSWLVWLLGAVAALAGVLLLVMPRRRSRATVHQVPDTAAGLDAVRTAAEGAAQAVEYVDAAEGDERRDRAADLLERRRVAR